MSLIDPTSYTNMYNSDVDRTYTIIDNPQNEQEYYEDEIVD